MRKRLMNIQTAIFVLMILAPVLTLILIKGNLSAAGDVLTITAKHITKVPNGVDDPVWQQAAEVEVPIEGRDVLARAKGSVMTQALYTDDSIYFRFTWKDPTRSVIKQSWISFALSKFPVISITGTSFRRELLRMSWSTLIPDALGMVMSSMTALKTCLRMSL